MTRKAKGLITTHLLMGFPLSPMFVSLQGCISTQLYSLPPIHHLQLLAALPPEEANCNWKSWNLRGQRLRVHHGNLLLETGDRNGKHVFCAKILIGKRRKDLYILSIPPLSLTQGRAFPMMGGLARSCWYRHTVWSPKPTALSADLVAAGKFKRLAQDVQPFAANTKTQRVIQQHKGPLTGPFSPENHLPCKS